MKATGCMKSTVPKYVLGYPKMGKTITFGKGRAGVYCIRSLDHNGDLCTRIPGTMSIGKTSCSREYL
jgi:hypothetical protein